MPRSDIRLALPSKGRMAQASLDFLEGAGLRVHKPNPRQFEATIPNLPELTVLFQRAGDIAVSVRDGSVDFGITGWDVVSERRGENGSLLPMDRELGFSRCRLHVIVPEAWSEVDTMADLRARSSGEDVVRVATKYPRLTRSFFRDHDFDSLSLIEAEGTLEAAPAIGYADVIVDLVSTGTTLRDNRLKTLDDGLILESQACLVGNRQALAQRPDVLEMGRLLLEYIEAHRRGSENVALFANIRGESVSAVGDRVLAQDVIGGLQGPTLSPVVTRQGDSWYAVNVVVRRSELSQAIDELRTIGGSGVVVTPVTYIFEEEPDSYRELLEALEQDAQLQGAAGS
ncbi:MAG: ATP phosphoribosyltransferase [Anaerolineales bacterium]|nr:ATP phosphoribosyltransferase [Anaerolineales bacterium]